MTYRNASPFPRLPAIAAEPDPFPSQRVACTRCGGIFPWPSCFPHQDHAECGQCWGKRLTSWLPRLNLR